MLKSRIAAEVAILEYNANATFKTWESWPKMGTSPSPKPKWQWKTSAIANLRSQDLSCYHECKQQRFDRLSQPNARLKLPPRLLISPWKIYFHNRKMPENSGNSLPDNKCNLYRHIILTKAVPRSGNLWLFGRRCIDLGVVFDDLFVENYSTTSFCHRKVTDIVVLLSKVIDIFVRCELRNCRGVENSSVSSAEYMESARRWSRWWCQWSYEMILMNVMSNNQRSAIKTFLNVSNYPTAELSVGLFSSTKPNSTQPNPRVNPTHGQLYPTVRSVMFL